MKYKTRNGTWHEVAGIKGTSAFESAQIGGWKDTEENFYKKLAKIATTDDTNQLSEEIVNLDDALEVSTGIGSEITADSEEDGLYNVIKDTIYTGTYYKHYTYTVVGGKSYYASGTSASNYTQYPLGAWYDSDGKYIESVGNTSTATFTDELITAPSNAVKIILNTKTSSISSSLKSQKLNTNLRADIDTLNSYKHNDYNLNIANCMVLEAKKNPFEFKTFDKPMISFVWDDNFTDLDLVASIFESYGYPIGVACIYDRVVNRTCDGLTADSGSYTVGMSMLNCVKQIVSLGGEVMTHNASNVVTSDTQYDYDFMYNYFITSKKNLESVTNVDIRGIIRAGGSGAISGTSEIEKWLIGNYEYSNIGTAVNFSQDRISIGKGVSYIESQIDDAITNNTWLKLMCHKLSDEADSGQLYISQADLITILDYIKAKGVTVCTYATVFDKYSSSKLLNSLT